MQMGERNGNGRWRFGARTQSLKLTTTHIKDRDQRSFEMTVRTLDRAVLVGDASIVARGLHLVMPHQALISLRQILLCVGRQITERR